jgi:hypothetical protein
MRLTIQQGMPGDKIGFRAEKSLPDFILNDAEVLLLQGSPATRARRIL